MSHSFSRSNLLLIAIVALAAFLRLYRLDQLPPGLEFDVAYKVFDTLRLLQGHFAIFFPAYTGREPLFHYLSMVTVALFGPTAFSAKLSAAIIGTATIPLIYGFARTLFGSVRIAALAAFFAAISFWHIFFSRVGYRVILLVPLTVMLFWCLWRAYERRRLRDYALAGLFAGLALYTYPSSRVYPVVLLFLAAYMLMTDRMHARQYVQGMALLFAVMAAVFLPLGAYFIVHPDQFFSHPADVSIFAPNGDQPVDIATTLEANALRLLGMFFLAGDGGALRNLPGRPVFDPLLGALFVAGVLMLVVSLFSPRSAALDRRRAVFLAAWLVLGLAISLVSVDAPNFSRTLFILPAIMILPAWGASEIWDRLRTPAARRSAAMAFGLVLVFSTGQSFRDYFDVFANDPGTYYAFDVDKVETAEWINRSAFSLHLYLAPLWSQNATIQLMTRYAPLKSFESRDTIVLPSAGDGKDALYGFPFEQERKVQTMETRLASLGTREELSGANGGKLLLLYRIPSRNLPDPQNPLGVLSRAGAFMQPQKLDGAVWGDDIKLLGHTLNPEGPGGRNLTVTLFFQALGRMPTDYTFSLKVRDAQGRVWGQEDKWPGDNSYATSQWSAGDVIVEKFYPGLSACAPAGDYRVSAEAYDPKTMQILQLTNLPENQVALGTFHAEASRGNRLEDLEPDRTTDKAMNDHLNLMGYTLSTDQIAVGDGLSLSLFWKGTSKEGGDRVTVHLQDAAKRDLILAEASVSLPNDGRGLCSFFDIKLPPEVAAGAASLWANDAKIADVKVSK